jgi:hypothetical protein
MTPNPNPPREKQGVTEMVKHALLATAAIFIASTPALAQEVPTGVTTNVTYDNVVRTRLVNSSTYTSDIGVAGDVTVGGDITVDSSANAQSDAKQIIDGDVAADVDDSDEARSSNVNVANGADVAADGNAGVNVAAGHYNAQSNIATIAVATGGDTNGNGADDDADSSGLAKANSTTLQSLTGTYAGAADDGDTNDTAYSRNQANGGAVGGNGNIGSNTAAGAFNEQQNVMTLAVASDAALAEATSGVVQYSTGNLATISDRENFASSGPVTGAGNIGVNVASGVGNMQSNTLTVAASGAFGANGTGGAGAGGLGTGL